MKPRAFIFTNKEKFGKPHNTSTHSKMGLAVLFGYAASVAFAYLTVDPDAGRYKTNRTIRTLHKYSSRAITALAWATSIVGWRAFWGGDTLADVLFIGPLLVAAFLLVVYNP